MSDDWTWDETLFAGVAPYYDAGRLPYAPGLADSLASALRLDGTGRLLDIGCGPGTLTLLFAHLFEEAVGLDPDAGMLAEGARLAEERNVTNVRWMQLRAEDLPAGLGSFRAITFGASFHWMDRPFVAATVRRMLDDGGAVVHVDNNHQNGVAPRAGAAFPAPPDDAITDLRRRYLGPDRRAGKGVRNASPSGEDAIFRDAGLDGPEVVRVEDGRLLERTLEDVVANIFSMSSTAPGLFGDRVTDFERDLRALLKAVSPHGRFNVQLPDNDLKIWRPRN